MVARDLIILAEILLDLDRLTKAQSKAGFARAALSPEIADQRADVARAERLLGVLASRTGDHDAAIGHFRAAVALGE